MFNVTSDPSQNCVTIAYSNRVTPDETRQCVEEVSAAVTKLAPGFRLLVDMTDLQTMDVSCAPHIRNLMDTCNQSGVSKVIRIIPNPKLDIGFQIMSYFHYRDDVQIVTCESLEEAMNLLAT